MKLSRRSFLKLLGLTPAVPFLNKDVFPIVSPSPTDILTKEPKPGQRDWKPEWSAGASAVVFSLPISDYPSASLLWKDKET